MTHVFVMWQNIFNFIVYFKFFERKKSWRTFFKIHFIQINKNIQRKYEQWKHQLILHYSKTKSSWSVFATVIFSYFGIDVLKFVKNEPENAKNLTVISAETKKSRSRFRNKWANFNNQHENVWKRFKNRQNYICKNCGDNHKLKNCLLTLNKNKFWIKNKNQNFFENNMKNSKFHKQIKNLRQIKSQ